MQIRRLVGGMVMLASCLATLLLLSTPGEAFADTLTVTTTNDSGAGSLRDAISQLNQRPLPLSGAPHSVLFQVPAAACSTEHVCTISLVSALPPITRTMMLDGWSQGGAGYQGPPLIELNGASAGAVGSHGLHILGDLVTVRGFVINRFSGNGIQVGDTASAPQVEQTFHTNIYGNYIGTDASGTVARGNAFAGIMLGNAFVTFIGGYAALNEPLPPGNLVSGNRAGVVVQLHADYTHIAGNLIGTASNGTTPLGNALNGILVTGGANVFVGPGTNPNIVKKKNTIAHNGSAGILVSSGDNVDISDNEFFGNAGLGIDLGDPGPTPNDLQDVDGGPNGLMNYPVIKAARHSSGGTFIAVTLNSEPSTTLTVRLFSDQACTDGGIGQGRSLLATQQVDTDQAGDAAFELTLPTSLASGVGVVATTERRQFLPGLIARTSEFSPCRTVADPGLIVGQTGTVETTEAGSPVSIPFSLAAPPTANVTLPISSTNIHEGTVSPASLTFTPTDWNVPQTVMVRGVDDVIADGDQTYTVAIGPISSADVGYDGLDPTNLNAVNHDNEGTPTLSVADVSMAEGNAGTSPMIFTVTLAPPTTQTVRVGISTAIGTAHPDDFTFNADVLIFGAGETSKSFAVTILGDTTVEPDETFFVNLVAPQNAVIGRAQARGVIVNDDVAPVTTCSPRPNPKIQTAQIGPGRLQVTVTSQSSATITANAMQRLDFDAGDNARVEIPGAAAGSPGGPSASGGPPGTATAFSLPLTGNPTTQIFIVQRQQPGAFKLSFAVTDGCSGSAGPFRTFVGGGAGVP